MAFDSRSDRKSGRRSLYPWINSQIIALADQSSVEELVDFIWRHASEMNLVNLATALHRLARRAAGGAALPMSLLQDLAARTCAVLKRSETSGGPPPCQSLANIAWAHAQLGFVSAAMLADVAEHAVKHLESFKAFELSTLLWALAKLGSADASVRACSQRLFQVAGERIADGAKGYPFRCLVMSCWAFAEAGHHDEHVFLASAPIIAKEARKACCQDLATALWAFCRARVLEPWFLEKLAKRATATLQTLPIKELRATLMAMAAVGFLPGLFLERAALVARGADVATFHLARALLRSQMETPKVEMLEQQDGSSLDTTRENSLAGDQSEGSEELECSTLELEKSCSQLPLRVSVEGQELQVFVRNTFLDVEAVDGPQETHPLPPALAFLPASMSVEGLADLRSKYRCLREGQAIGCLGRWPCAELATSLL